MITLSRLTNHQIRHQAANKVGCQPGDCIWSLQSSSGVCVGIYWLTYSLYHPERKRERARTYLNHKSQLWVPSPSKSQNLRFASFYDTWLNKDIWCHVRPYSYLCLQITKLDMRSPADRWLQIATIFLRGLCGYVWVIILTLSPLRVQIIREKENGTGW